MLGVRTELTPQRQELLFSSFFNGGNSPLIEISSRKILGSRFEADNNYVPTHFFDMLSL